LLFYLVSKNWELGHNYYYWGPV